MQRSDARNRGGFEIQAGQAVRSRGSEDAAGEAAK